MKTTLTYRHLLDFNGMCQKFIKMCSVKNASADEIGPIVLLVRASKKLLKPLEDYEEELETLRIKHCLKDPDTKRIIKEEGGGYAFSEEGNLNLIKDHKALLAKSVETHYNENLAYADLYEILPKESKPFYTWEDVREQLEPLYVWNKTDEAEAPNQ